MKSNELRSGLEVQAPKEGVNAVPQKLPVSPTPPDTSTIDSLRELARHSATSPSGSVLSARPQKLSKKYQEIRKLTLENDGTEKDQNLKGETLHKLFWLFYGETMLVFIVTFLQGFKLRGFNLDQWTLRVVVAATLTQTTGMLLIAVKHLFPDKKR